MSHTYLGIQMFTLLDVFRQQANYLGFGKVITTDSNHPKTEFSEKDSQKNKKDEEPDRKRNKDSLGRFSSSCAKEICSFNTMKNFSMIVQCIE